MGENINVIDLLLSQTPVYPQKSIKMIRLSKALGQDVVFKIRGLDYKAVDEFLKGSGGDSDISIVLHGLLSPDLKDARLLQKYGALTPAELLRDQRFLRPGEVQKLSNEIARLSGYSENILEEITKN